MSSSYYDIDAILTDAQARLPSTPTKNNTKLTTVKKVPTTFELDIPALGYLDNSAGHTLKSGTRVDLPLWLSEMLAVSSTASSRTPSKNLVTLDLPPSLGPRVMNALKADPKSVDLRTQAQHFYGLAERILELFEEDDVCDVLMESWRKRAAEISDHASQVGQGGRSSVASGDGVEFLRGLDEWERDLFRRCHDSGKSMRVWMGEVKKN